MFNFNLDLITPEFFYEKKTSSSPNVKRETENIGVIKLAHDDKSVRDQIDSFFNQNLFFNSNTNSTKIGERGTLVS